MEITRVFTLPHRYLSLLLGFYNSRDLGLKHFSNTFHHLYLEIVGRIKVYTSNIYKLVDMIYIKYFFFTFFWM